MQGQGFIVTGPLKNCSSIWDANGQGHRFLERGLLTAEVCCAGPGRSAPACFAAGAAAWLEALAAAGAGFAWALGPCNLGRFASIS